MAPWFTRLIVFLSLLLAFAAASFWTFWTPLPFANARDALGTERIVDLDGRRLAYYISGKGPSVLLIASLGREASDFNELVGALNNAGYRTIAIEAHGIGNSALPGRDFNLIEIADDVAAVAEHEITANERVVVIGHAFGNRVARAFAARNDDRVRGLVLIASGGEKAMPPMARQALGAIFDPRQPFARRASAVDFAFFADGNSIPEHWMRGWHTQTAIWQGNAAQHAYEEWGAGGTKSMLILQAQEDEIAPPEDAGMLLARQFPDRARLVVVRGAGHAFLPERPTEVASEIIIFINDLGSTS